MDTSKRENEIDVGSYMSNPLKLSMLGCLCTSVSSFPITETSLNLCIVWSGVHRGEPLLDLHASSQLTAFVHVLSNLTRSSDVASKFRQTARTTVGSNAEDDID